MKSKLRIFLAFSLVMIVFGSGCSKCKQETAAARPLPASLGTYGPVVAGAFYPGDPAELKTMVQSYLDQASAPELSGKLFGVMSPHAGYIFSGPVAAYAYKALAAQGKKKFVIIAPSHHYPGAGLVAVLNADYYQTPLGKVKIARDKAQELYSQGDWVTADTQFFSQEHAGEVQIPFLQTAMGDEIEIALIVMPDPRLEVAQKLAAALLKVFPPDQWLFIASSDMSHYHSDAIAKQMDRNSLNLIEQMNIDQLSMEGSGPVRTAELCGLGPVLAVMQAFKDSGSGVPVVLNARNSFDTTGQNPDRVVGYGSVAFVLGGQAAAKPAGAEPEVEELKPYGGDLSQNQKKALMKIARLSVETYVKENKIPELSVTDPRLKEIGAAFVRLKKFGDLRGCIGHVLAQEPLYLCVRDVACSAAKHDPRFPPVSKEELKDLEYEISVLSPLAPVRNLAIIKVGRDGLVMRMGPYQGLLLPQVPVEQGWDHDTFLSHTCLKAGMSSDCWHNPEVQIFRFQGLVFGEKELK